MAKKTKQTGLLAYMDAQIEKLRENLSAALMESNADAVHQARVATRRLAAAVDLLKPVLTKDHRTALRDGLKKIRRQLGPLRDADVMLDHLSTWNKPRPESRPTRRPASSDAVCWLTERLSSSRQKLYEDARERSPEKLLKRLEDWPRVRSETSGAEEAVNALLAESLHLQTIAFAEQADQLAKRSAARGEREAATSGESTDSDPHELRIVGKALRYTLEMSTEQGRSPGNRVMKTFKRMQDQLGIWHDYVVLADRALREVLDAELALHEPALAGRVLALAQATLERATKELAGFTRLWERQGQAIVAAVHRAALPLTKSVDHPPVAGTACTTENEPPTTIGADVEEAAEMDADSLASNPSEGNSPREATSTLS